MDGDEVCPDAAADELITKYLIATFGCAPSAVKIDRCAILNGAKDLATEEPRLQVQ